MNELLKQEGYDVAVAGESEKAITMVQEKDFHLNIINVNMPYVAGRNVYFEIKKLLKHKPIPMMIISGGGIEPALIQAIKQGKDSYLSKPSDIDLIRERVKQCLTRDLH